MNTLAMTTKKPDLGTHENYGRVDAIRLGSDRNFGLTFAVFFLIVAFLPLLSGRALRPWALVCALLFFVLAFVAPQFLRTSKILWAQLGMLLQKIISPIILSALFFLIFTPIGLFLRLFKKDVLSLRLDPESTTYWLNSEPPQSTMKDQF